MLAWNAENCFPTRKALGYHSTYHSNGKNSLNNKLFVCQICHLQSKRSTKSEEAYEFLAHRFLSPSNVLFMCETMDISMGLVLSREKAPQKETVSMRCVSTKFFQEKITASTQSNSAQLGKYMKTSVAQIAHAKCP